MLSHWPCLLNPSFILVNWKGTEKNQFCCLKRVGDVFLNGVVYLITHVIHIMGWLGCFWGHKWTDSSCQLPFCMLTTELTVNMLMYQLSSNLRNSNDKPFAFDKMLLIQAFFDESSTSVVQKFMI